MQTYPRLYFLFPFQPHTGLRCTLQRETAHYLAHVLRRKVGDGVMVFNAEVGEWESCIVEMKKNTIEIELVHQVRSPEQVEDFPVLAFAPLKRDSFDLVVRMGTELGVRCFAPVITRRTNTHRVNKERMEVIAKEAVEQCERIDLPLCEDVQTLEQFLARWPQDKILGVAIERMNAQITQDIHHSASNEGHKSIQDAKPMRGILIGPEGGFSPEEIRFIQNKPFVRPFSLGARILKAETAAVAALVLYFIEK